MISLESVRLRLRPWNAADRPLFRALNGDPEVMALLGDPLTVEQSDALMERLQGALEQRGFGFWAVERREQPGLLGFVGLSIPSFEAPFTPCVEIGWRLARSAWGHGYATEAARCALDFGFATLGLAEIVSFTVPQNVRSRAVMERIGMMRDAAGDFDHPKLPAGHPLRRHVLYRIGGARHRGMTSP